MFAVGLQRGSDTAPVFSTTPNYTVTSHTATFSEAAGTMTASGTPSGGAPSFTPTTAIPATIGQLYQVVVPVTTYSSGTFTVTYGGVSSPAVTPAANNTYTFYILATSTGSLTITGGASGAQSYVITNMTVKRAAYDPTSGANIPIVIDTNLGLTVPNTVYMPPATVGWVFKEYAKAAYSVVLKTAQGTDTWDWGTSTYTNSMTLVATVETSVTFSSYVNAYWDLEAVNGSVTPN
jgi:hypothetical protein